MSFVGGNMAPKRAKFYTYGEDAMCVETKEFIENAGILIEVRDIAEQPLTINEMDGLFKHIDIRHFLDVFSEAYTKFRLDKNLPPREKVFELMAGDHTLIRRPIVKTARLLLVGCDKRKVAEMFQISANGSQPREEANSPREKHQRNSHEAAAASRK
jgi:arsenate reductase-like glutaredoxin family protein